MAIQFRRGYKADLVSAQLLTGEPAYCTDTHELHISRGNGVTDVFRTSTPTLLWSSATAAIPGDICTLSDAISRYQFVMFKVNTLMTFPIAPVHPSTLHIRASGIYASDTTEIDIFAIRGTYYNYDNDAGYEFTIDNVSGLHLATSGITAISGATGITEIWGLG
jgi:hypothetical protein